jgi:anti-anti-sigma factor
VITLSGEADVACVGQLAGLIDALIPARLDGERRELTIDVAALRYADSAAIREFVLAALALRKRGGSLVLLRPRQPVAGILTLLGADQMLTIRGQPQGAQRAGRGTPNATPATPAE